jgi:hypothetical protein
MTRQQRASFIEFAFRKPCLNFFQGIRRACVVPHFAAGQDNLIESLRQQVDSLKAQLAGLQAQRVNHRHVR